MTKLSFYGRIPQDEEDELGDYNSLIITKLLKNYRSHPSILEVSSNITMTVTELYLLLKAKPWAAILNPAISFSPELVLN